MAIPNQLITPIPDPLTGTQGLMTQTAQQPNGQAQTALMATTPAASPVGYEAQQLGTPTKWNVADNQTVAGNVRNLISENSPLQQQAETRAKQQMNQNGLLNSTMAVQAGQAALYDAAIPIATTDAGTYGRSAAYNADSQNQFAGKNLDAFNTAANATSNIRANTARDTAQTVAQANTASNLAGVNLTTAENLAQTNTATAELKARNDVFVAAAGAANDRLLTELRGNITRTNIGQEQSILMSRNLTDTINQINMNSNLDANGKTAQIAEAVKAANNTFAAIHSVSQLTGTLLHFSTPTTTASTPAPNGNPVQIGDPTLSA